MRYETMWPRPPAQQGKAIVYLLKGSEIYRYLFTDLYLAVV